MKRAYAVLAVFLFGCVAPLTAPEAPEQMPKVIIPLPMQAFLNELAMRMHGNANLPDMENLLCVYGTVRGREIRIERFAPTTILARDSVSLEYDPCNGPDLLGTWHNHPDLEGYISCEFSEADIHSFREMDETIAILSCFDGKQRLVSRVKRGYSKTGK